MRGGGRSRSWELCIAAAWLIDFDRLEAEAHLHAVRHCTERTQSLDGEIVHLRKVRPRGCVRPYIVPSRAVLQIFASHTTHSAHGYPTDSRKMAHIIAVLTEDISRYTAVLLAIMRCGCSDGS